MIETRGWGALKWGKMKLGRGGGQTGVGKNIAGTDS